MGPLKANVGMSKTYLLKDDDLGSTNSVAITPHLSAISSATLRETVKNEMNFTST